MDRAIAVVCNKKTRVYIHDFTTQNWNNLSSTNGYCRIKVVERGRRQYLIEIIDEEKQNNATQYSISEKCEVTKTRDMLQIPATNPNPCLLGVQFRDPNEEIRFLMIVGEFIPGFKLSLQNMNPEVNPPALPTRPANNHQASLPNQGYIKPTLPPSNMIEVHSPDRLPPLATRTPRSGDVMHNKPPANERKDLPYANPNNNNMEPKYNPQGRREQDYPPHNQSYRASDLGGRTQNEVSNRPRQNAWEEERQDKQSIHQQEGYHKQWNPPDHQMNRMYQQPEQNAHPSYRQGNQEHQRDRMYQPKQTTPPSYRRDNYEHQRDRMYPPQQNPPSSYRQDNQRDRMYPSQPNAFPSYQGYDYPSPSLSSMRASSQADFQMDMTHYTQQLATALSSCNKEASVELVEVLASLLSEQREENKSSLGLFSFKYEADKETSSNELFNLGLQVEEFEGESYPVFITVTQNDTIEQLKQLCCKKFKLPKESQTWIHGKQIVENKMCLKELEITEDGDTIHVYVQHPKKVKGMTNIVMSQLIKEVGGALLQPGMSPSLPHNPALPMAPILPAKPRPVGGYPLESVDNQSSIPIKPPARFIPMEVPPEIPARQKNHPVIPYEVSHDGQAFYRGSIVEAPPIIPPIKSPIGGIRVMPAEVPQQQKKVIEEPLPPILPRPPPTLPGPPPGWDCPACTYHNEPYRPGCFMCNGVCPEDYVPPIDYVLTEEEKKFVDETKQQDILLQQMFQKEQEQMRVSAAKNYDNLIQTDDQPIVTNNEEFDCPICYAEIEPGEGITLRSCLHQVCKECLRHSVTNSEHVQVYCPFAGDDYECDEFISDREIRTVLNDQELEALYNRGLRQAEAAARDSFHCQTTDCPGFCFYEDEVNHYKCPICGNLNCILCKAQHDGMNCQEYQEDLKLKAVNDEAARQTQDMLDKMVNDGEAMHCPQCRVIVTKKAGCDWIKCTVCKTEMCWATKGPRWGPKGRGDTTGGCKCGLNRKRCHPNCRNCH